MSYKMKKIVTIVIIGAMVVSSFISVALAAINFH